MINENRNLNVKIVVIVLLWKTKNNQASKQIKYFLSGWLNDIRWDNYAINILKTKKMF